MNKLLEALERTSGEFIDGYPTGNVNVGMTWEEHKAIKQALLELKAIKEANPSEAIEKLDNIKNRINFYYEMYKFDDLCKDEIDTIKQALTKAQEQEKVLSIIKEKCLTNCNLALVEDNVHYENYCKEFEYFLNKYNESPNGFEITKEDLLTQEEFDTVKRWAKDEHKI